MGEGEGGIFVGFGSVLHYMPCIQDDITTFSCLDCFPYRVQRVNNQKLHLITFEKFVKNTSYALSNLK